MNLCLADATADGAVAPDDVIAFASRYTANDPSADLDHDSAVGPADVLLFGEAYNCECGTP